MDYRPLAWTEDQWHENYADHHADSHGALDEAARYGVLLAYLGFHGGTPTVLDVGCGAGVLRRRLGTVPFSSYLGVDPTAAAIDQARELEDERTSFRVADPMVDDVGRHDVVVCNEVLYFAPDPEQLVDRLGSLAHPGGLLLTSIWRHPGDTVLWGWIDDRYELLDRVAVRNPRNRFAPRGWQVACHRAPA
jgi:2-polyprenyl-3-methyl-5-hydroxy-6-metoxy-1,4-benzoquinol methylase